MTQTSEPGIKSEHGEGDMEAVETIDTCLQERRSASAHAAVTIRTLLFSAVSLLVTTGVSSASDPNIISGMHGGDLATITPSFPPITLWVQKQPSPLSRSSERFTRMSQFFRRSL